MQPKVLKERMVYFYEFQSAWTKWKNRNLWTEQAQLLFRFRKREFTRRGWSYFLPTRKGNSLQENYFRW